MIPGLARGAFRAAAESIAQHLRTWPTLANERTVRTWIRWDGRGPVAAPAVPTMPAVQLRLIGGGSSPLASTRARGGPATQAIAATATIVVDVWTKGTDAADATDLGEAIFDAFFPRGAGRAEVDAKFHAAAIRSRSMTRMILPPSAEAYQSEYVYAQGLLEITLHLDA